MMKVVSKAGLYASAMLLMLPLSTKSKAQQPPSNGQVLSAAEKWQVETVFRSYASIPPESTVEIGPRTSSPIAAYDYVEVSYQSAGTSAKPLSLLLSKDGKSMAQFRELALPVDMEGSLANDTRPARGGPVGAPVLILVFDDLECPFCARSNQTLFPAVVDRYKGKVRVVYRDMPSEGHPWSFRAAIDSNCLGNQNADAYWEAVDKIHLQAGELGGTERSLSKANEHLDSLTREIGQKHHLQNDPLVACIAKQDLAPIQKSEQEAIALGVSKTPTLFINGAKVEGAVSQSFLFALIDKALEAKGAIPPTLLTPIQ